MRVDGGRATHAPPRARGVRRERDDVSSNFGTAMDCACWSRLVVCAAIVIGAFAAWLLRHRGDHAPIPAACPDYNSSCLKPCAACVRLAQDGCARCSRQSRHQCSNRSSLNVQKRRALRWLHIPKCGATLAVSILSYSCADTVPSWHVVGMALRGGRIDVRMARALRARHGVRGHRCGGRLLLPFDGHRPVSAFDVQRGGLVAFFRRPAQRLISACARRTPQYLAFRATALPESHARVSRSQTSTIITRGACRRGSALDSSVQPRRSQRLRVFRASPAARRRCSPASLAPRPSISPMGGSSPPLSPAYARAPSPLLVSWRNGIGRFAHCTARYRAGRARSPRSFATSVTQSIHIATSGGCRPRHATVSTTRALLAVSSMRRTSVFTERRASSSGGSRHWPHTTLHRSQSTHDTRLPGGDRRAPTSASNHVHEA